MPSWQIQRQQELTKIRIVPSDGVATKVVDGFTSVFDLFEL